MTIKVASVSILMIPPIIDSSRACPPIIRPRVPLSPPIIGIKLTASFSGWLHGEIWIQTWSGAQRRSFIIFRFDNGSSRPSLISWLISVSCGDISVFTSQIFLFGDKFVIMTNMTLGTLSECLKFPELGSCEPRKDTFTFNLNMLHVQFMIEKFKINVNACQLCG